MLRKFVALVAFGILVSTSLAGCYSTGRATGEAAEGVERGAREFERGYDAGKK